MRTHARTPADGEGDMHAFGFHKVSRGCLIWTWQNVVLPLLLSILLTILERRLGL